MENTEVVMPVEEVMPVEVMPTEVVSVEEVSVVTE
jgi:hypothetical protein